jgi:hypothetical protein
LMTQTKVALFRWLTEAGARARDGPTAEAIKTYTEEADVRWKDVEPLTDVETGTVYTANEAECARVKKEERS